MILNSVDHFQNCSVPRLPFTGLTGSIDWHRLTGPSDWRRLSPVRPAPKHALKMAAMPSWARHLWAPGGAMRAVRTVSGAPRVSAAAERGAARCGQRRGPHGDARRIFPFSRAVPWLFGSASEALPRAQLSDGVPGDPGPLRASLYGCPGAIGVLSQPPSAFVFARQPPPRFLPRLGP